MLDFTTRNLRQIHFSKKKKIKNKVEIKKGRERERDISTEGPLRS